MNFDDQDTEHGFFVAVLKLVDSVRGIKRDWHVGKDELGGSSMLSALCDDRFEDVRGLFPMRATELNKMAIRAGTVIELNDAQAEQMLTWHRLKVSDGDYAVDLLLDKRENVRSIMDMDTDSLREHHAYTHDVDRWENEGGS